MYKFLVKVGAYFLLILSFLLFVPYHVGRITFNKFRKYLSDVSYKADDIIKDWRSSDEE